MRKIVVSALLSLDGVAEKPHTFDTDWDDDAMDAATSAATATQDAVILGRRSYDEWAPFWPDSTIEPFATFINTVAKFVVTSTLLDVAWSNAHVVDGDLVEFARELKERPGGDIGVHASISVAGALLAAGLVDELQLVIVAAIAGSPTPAARRAARPAARTDPQRDVAHGQAARGLPRRPLAAGARHPVDDPRVDERRLAPPLVPPALAAVPGDHLRAQQHRRIAGRGMA